MAISQFIPQIWAAALMEAYHSNAIVVPTVDHEYEGEAAKGNAVKITTVTTPTITDYSTSRTLTPQALADTDVTLLINQMKAFGFYVDDVDAMQAAGSFAAVTADAGAALVEDAESYLLQSMITGGTALDSVDLSSADEAFSAVVTLRQALNQAKVPYSSRYLACNPEFASLLLGTDSKLVKVNESGDSEGLRNGLIGQLLGFDVLETPMLDGLKEHDGTTAIAAGLPVAIAYQANGAAFVSQMDKTEALRAPDRFDDIIRGLHVYGAKVLRPTSVQVLVGAAPDGGTTTP